VNDASTDSSLVVMQELQEQYSNIIKIINLEKNCRQGGARNIGVQAARGKWILFVDSDDWVETEELQKFIDFSLNDDVETDVIYTPYYNWINSNNKRKVIQHNKHRINGEVLNKDRANLIVDPISVWSALYSKRYLTLNNMVFAENIAFEDNLWALEIASTVKIIKCIDCTYYNYRYNEYSTTNRKNMQHHLDKLIIADKILKYYKKNNLDIEYKQEVEYWYIHNLLKGGIDATMLSCIPPRYTIANKIKAIIIENIRNFRSNRWYKLKYPFLSRLKFDLFLISPRTFNLYTKIHISLARLKKIVIRAMV